MSKLNILSEAEVDVLQTLEYTPLGVIIGQNDDPVRRRILNRLVKFGLATFERCKDGRKRCKISYNGQRVLDFLCAIHNTIDDTINKANEGVGSCPTR